MKYYSDVTKKIYNTAEECQAAEAAVLKAEEEKKNGKANALAEIDLLTSQFEEAQKAQEVAYKALLKASETLHKKYVDYQQKYGRLPDKYYTNYILTRML